MNIDISKECEEDFYAYCKFAGKMNNLFKNKWKQVNVVDIKLILNYVNTVWFNEDLKNKYILNNINDDTNEKFSYGKYFLWSGKDEKFVNEMYNRWLIKNSGDMTVFLSSDLDMSLIDGKGIYQDNKNDDMYEV